MKDMTYIFSWRNMELLFGLPYVNSQIQDLFAQANLQPDKLSRELRIGIDSMPPYDTEPASTMEIDLSPSYHVRLRFKKASEVKGAKTDNPQTFVLGALTYFLNVDDTVNGYKGLLPAGIESTDTADKIIERLGRPPTEQDFHNELPDGYLVWEDQNPVLHVLFEGALKRVNVFLASTYVDNDD
jgi:hypothetical protein